VSGVTEVLELLAVMLFATSFRTAFGFGEALIAVPLLSLILPVKEAAPVAVLASVVIAGFVVARERKEVHFSSVWRLLLATVFGIPFGLALLRFAPEFAVKAALGVFVAAFAGFSLRKTRSSAWEHEGFVWMFGFFAGVAGGSYGMNGPPLAVYGAGRGWTARQFRATLQAYFLPASVLGMAGYYAGGLWTARVNGLFLEALPAIALGIFVGIRLGRRLESGRFERALHGALLFVAALLLFQAFQAARGG
jgi:uncharacterized membrane protein YfcA